MGKLFCARGKLADSERIRREFPRAVLRAVEVAFNNQTHKRIKRKLRRWVILKSNRAPITRTTRENAFHTVATSRKVKGQVANFPRAVLRAVGVAFNKQTHKRIKRKLRRWVILKSNRAPITRTTRENAFHTACNLADSETARRELSRAVLRAVGVAFNKQTHKRIKRKPRCWAIAKKQPRPHNVNFPQERFSHRGNLAESEKGKARIIPRGTPRRGRDVQ